MEDKWHLLTVTNIETVVFLLKTKQFGHRSVSFILCRCIGLKRILEIYTCLFVKMSICICNICTHIVYTQRVKICGKVKTTKTLYTPEWLTYWKLKMLKKETWTFLTDSHRVYPHRPGCHTTSSLCRRSIRAEVLCRIRSVSEHRATPTTSFVKTWRVYNLSSKKKRPRIEN